MKVIVTDEVAREGLALLEEDPRVEMDIRLGLKKEELLSIIGDYEVIVTRSGTTVDRELLDAAHRTREAGFHSVDAYSPMPVEGLSDAIG